MTKATRLRDTLFGSAALFLPLALQNAMAQTVVDIDGETTMPVETGTIDNGNPGDINITDGGSITIDSGTAVTVNSNNSVTHAGTITIGGDDDGVADGSIGILVDPGVEGDLTISGSIILEASEAQNELADENEVPDYNDNRAGLRIAEGGTFTGDILMSTGTSIQVSGDFSQGVDIAGDVDGLVQLDGDIAVRGQESQAVRIAGTTSGDVTMEGGNVAASGMGSTAVSVENTIGGAFILGSRVTASAYTTLAPTGEECPEDDDECDQEARDAAAVAAQVAMQPAGGVVINADIASGLVVEGAVATEFRVEATDDDPGYEAPAFSGSVSVTGSSNAVYIGGTTDAPVTLGAYTTENVTDDYGSWGFVNRGSLQTNGTLAGASAEAVRIENALIENGFRNDGIVEGVAVSNSATGLAIGSGAQLDEFLNAGILNAVVLGDSLENPADPATAAQSDAIALLIEAGGNVAALTNTGSILTTANSDEADATAIRDLSNALASVRNTGTISARVTDFADSEDLLRNDDGDLVDPDGRLIDEDGNYIDANGNFVNADGQSVSDPVNSGGPFLDTVDPVGRAIAMDFSASTIDVNVYNTAPDDFDGSRTTRGRVIGDVLFGTGNDTYRADAGSTSGNVEMGAGNDTVDLSQGALIAGDISFGDGNNALRLNDGDVVGDLSFGAGADIIDLTNGSNFIGGLTDADDTIAISVSDNSNFSLTTLGRTNISSLSVDETSVLGISFDLETDDETAEQFIGTQIVASGNVTFADGARISPRFLDIVTESFSSEIISANALSIDPGQIVIGDEDGNTPFLFEFDLSFEGDGSSLVAGQDALVLNVTRKTAETIGLDDDFSQAFEPLLAVLATDQDLGLEILNSGSEEAFMDAFQQMLAGPIDAPLAYARAQNNAVTSIITQRLDMARNSGEFGRTVWLQEENYFLNRDDDETSNGYDGGGWALATGLDFQLEEVVDAIGVSASVSSARYDEQNGEDFPFNRLTYGAGLYGAFSFNDVKFDVRGAYAVSDSDSERRIVIGDERRIAEGEWEGTQIAGSARLHYDTEIAGYTVEPFVSVDYIHIEEDGFTETGGGDAVNLVVSDREATSLRTNVGARLGKVYEIQPSAYDTGIPGTIHPQLTLAWSQELETDPIEAEFQYAAGGESFTLYSDPEDGAAIVGADVAYENEYAKVHVGASGTFGDKSEAYMLRVGVGLKW